MNLIIEIGVFILGLLLGMWWFVTIILPLFHGVPKAILQVRGGFLKAVVVALYLLRPLIWSLAIFIIVLVIPNLANWLLNSSAFGAGLLLGIGVMLLRLFTKQGRADLDKDFWSFVDRGRLKAEGNVSDPLEKMLNHAKRINDYFANAVKVYVFLDKKDARIAALAAGKVAASVQRSSMIDYLEGLASDLGTQLPELLKKMPETEMVINRIKDLKEHIEEKDWTIKDIIDEKQRLQKVNPEYLNALEKADSDIFVHKYSDLFSDKEIKTLPSEEIVKSAGKERKTIWKENNNYQKGE